MTLSPRLCAEIIRQRMGLKDDSQAARIINQIPATLKAFGRKYAADPYTRPLVSSAKSSTTLPIGAGGAVNLITGYDTYQFLLEYLDLGQLYLVISATITAVGVVADNLTIEPGVKWYELTPVQFTVSGGTLPTGIAALTTYYLINYDQNTGLFQLSPTSDGLGLVNITTTGSGTLTMTQTTVTGAPMQMLKNPQQASLTQYLDDVFQYCYVEGDTLFVLPTTATGSVAFSVPCYPVNLAALPDSDEAEREFLQILMNMVAVPVQEA